jgi:hypothetical protein
MLIGMVAGGLGGALSSGLKTAFGVVGKYASMAVGFIGNVLASAAIAMVQGAKFGAALLSSAIGAARGMMQQAIGQQIADTIKTASKAGTDSPAVAAITDSSGKNSNAGETGSEESILSDTPADKSKRKTNLIRPKVGLDAAAEVNIALDQAGSGQGFSTPEEAASAFSNAANSIAEKFDTEIGAKIFQKGAKFFLGSAHSDGVICSVSAACSVNIAVAGSVAGALRVGSIHTHPSNNKFSDQDLYVGIFDSIAERRPQTIFVSLKNGQVWRWSTLEYKNGMSYSDMRAQAKPVR